MCFFVKSKGDDYITTNKLINSIAKTEFSSQIKARYKFSTTTQYSQKKVHINHILKTIMGNFNSKYQEDKNCQKTYLSKLWWKLFHI